MAPTLDLVPIQKFVIAVFAASIIFSVFYFSLPSAAGTADAEAFQRQEESDKLAANIRSAAVFGLAPIITGGASVWTVAKVKKASIIRPLPLVVGFAVALGTLGLAFLL